MTSVSVIIITFNEEKRIKPCLESIKWADEIIIIDSGSTDKTVEICKQYTPNVHQFDWPGFGIQKNRALSYATSDWILSIDADEQVPLSLQKEIKEKTISSNANIYEIPRLSSFCGKFLHHGGWWPDYVARLFRKGAAQFSEDIVHERLIYSENSSRLTHHLEHHSITDLESMLNKLNHYSTAGSEKMASQNREGGLWKALTHGFWIFFRTYILRLGFLDGKEGFIMAISAGENTYYRYLKAYYLTKRL